MEKSNYFHQIILNGLNKILGNKIQKDKLLNIK